MGSVNYTVKNAMIRTTEELLETVGSDILVDINCVMEQFEAESLEGLNNILKSEYGRAILPVQADSQSHFLTDTATTRVTAELKFPMHINAFFKHLELPVAG